MTTDQKVTAKTLTESQRSEMISQVHARISDFVEGKNRRTNKQHKDNIRDLMLASTDNGVVAMHEYFMADLTLTMGEERFRDSLIVWLNMSSAEGKSSTVHEFLNFKAFMSTTGLNPHGILSILRSLHGYQQLPPMEDYSYADEPTKRKIAALLTITTILHNRYQKHIRETAGSNGSGLFSTNSAPIEFGLPLEVNPPMSLIGDALIDLVIDQPESAEEIARYIIEEGISDGALLREIFTSGTQSLRNGLL